MLRNALPLPLPLPLLSPPRHPRGEIQLPRHHGPHGAPSQSGVAPGRRRRRSSPPIVAATCLRVTLLDRRRALEEDDRVWGGPEQEE
ncbi:hypothetical protein NL676_007173 [Syzygium grande]|nr:hypothetical protein NL676_007173 [Syzygium grande]